jgi:tellurite resistance protein
MEDFIWSLIVIFIVRIVWAALASQARESRGSSPAAHQSNRNQGYQSPPASMPEYLQFRFVDARLGDDNDGPFVKEIKGRGPIPIRRPTRIGFITSVFDTTSGDFEPVASAIESFQEPQTTVYQHRLEVGNVLPDQGFVDWVRIGVVLPELLEPPYSGQRKMVAVVRMVDLGNPPDVMHGFNDSDHPGLLLQRTLEFSWTFKEKGYKEAAEHREEATAIAIKIGIAVAMADGSLENREGAILKSWIGRRVHHLSQERQEVLKKVYNDAMRGAYLEAKRGELKLEELTRRMDEIGDTTTKYEAVELCFDVMAGDGVATAEELRIIRDVAEALDLDVGEIEKMRDQRLISLNSSIESHASIEEMLGILPGWDNEHVRKHLRLEFQKWNNRMTHLADEQERVNAQRMLDVIAEARQKYV